MGCGRRGKLRRVLTWELEWGPQLESLKKLHAGGIEVQALQNRPTISQWVIEYWDAFQILSGSRATHQGGIGTIPLSEMVAYMEATYLTDVDERLRFIRMIQSLDQVYVIHVNDKAKRQNEQAQRQAKSAPRKR